MSNYTDFDWTTTRERNLKKTKKDTRREMDIDIDGLPQESNGGYDMVGKQSPSDKMITSPTASRRNKMIPKWLDKTISAFAGKKIGEEKVVTSAFNLNLVDEYLDKNRIHLDEVSYCKLAEKVQASGANDFIKIAKLVKEVSDEAIREAMSTKKEEKIAGKYDYKFNTVIGKAQKSQVKLADEGDITIADMINDVAAKMKTEITSDEIHDVTDKVKNEIGKKRHASNADIKDIVYKQVQIIANKNVAKKLAHNGIRTTVDQINLESAREAALHSTVFEKKTANDSNVSILKSAMSKVKEAAERMQFPQSNVSVTTQEKMPEGYEKENIEKGKTQVTPATTQASRLFQKIIDTFNNIKEIEAAVQKEMENVKKEKGLPKETAKLEEAVVALATIAGTASNNVIQIKDKEKAIYDYAILVTKERTKEEPTQQEIEAEVKKKIPFFNFEEYQEMQKTISNSIKAIKATRDWKYIEKTNPELKLVTKGEMNKLAAFEELTEEINALTGILEQFNSMMESDIEQFEAEVMPEEGTAEEGMEEALPLAASVKPVALEKKAEIGNDVLLRTAGYPDRYPYVDKCRNCAFFYSGIGTIYEKCVDCIHFYSEEELKEMTKEDASGLGDYFYDKSNRYNVGIPSFQQKHSSLKV
jgi:hypothetical protein